MLPALRQKTAKLFHRIAQSVPHFCALCHDVCTFGLCDSCRSRYFADNPTRCRQCAHPLAENKSNAILCGACLKRAPAFDRVIAVTDYAPPADQLVHSLKFGGNLALAPLFARLLEQVMQKQNPEDFPRPSILAPVPLSDERLIARGFNQALEIARPLSRQLGIPLIPRLICRIRETASQTVIALKERHKNVRDAFLVNEAHYPEIRGQHVAIVDDVLTTGETMGELARMLKQAGAARVSGLVFARTPL